MYILQLVCKSYLVETFLWEKKTLPDCIEPIGLEFVKYILRQGVIKSVSIGFADLPLDQVLPAITRVQEAFDSGTRPS